MGNDKYIISLEDISYEELGKLFGPNEKYLDVIREHYKVDITFRDSMLTVLSDDSIKSKRIEAVVKYMLEAERTGINVQEREVMYACTLADKNCLDRLARLHKEVINKTSSGKFIYPKTLGQSYLYKCMREKDIVFASGVAGTGKTYLAVMYAISLLKKNEVEKIILTRPAVEAGENLGFLPGDLKEKVDPYLTPLYDALHDALGVETVEKLLEKEVIEIAPLAYMRGRTLNNAFIILDEAQNSTRSQMKMFLTRMGFHSKVVVTGDITQIDLIKKKDSGLLSAKQILHSIEDIAFVELTSADVVRNPLVQKIIDCYENFESE
ncbi:phosphate starvation-inducible PhoH-like protein [Breznakia sp. PF5-3]|uniref:PhoH family protein n=1 Tax=unclassified Breznakia TaxID=2623764 RepID=UPI0024061DDC|nr:MULTISPECIES: PhoH family protein [unclassified Breznakia]MDL2276117.1 PhoH family protein [Breznakia sp. OttesenSCG-928-G09]MDF9824435.1 phosphate starvation-inducible PhoH-like protein [Breznakia sp. PM6-1]MDF9835164.1 phosphate starvation-inducible PhoH-like protein [Breznakia sp. PF5-3]MDF9838311.1 phosphate starvation-inducible PhoH-like protein [Breznakia sp. PFB2-8]MDF9860327.1 phosphate starvation-inducible PhoH-like protein [Breznakia sp. PH5-24]